jgi:hypothetical protein
VARARVVAFDRADVESAVAALDARVAGDNPGHAAVRERSRAALAARPYAALPRPFPETWIAWGDGLQADGPSVARVFGVADLRDCSTATALGVLCTATEARVIGMAQRATGRVSLWSVPMATGGAWDASYGGPWPLVTVELLRAIDRCRRVSLQLDRRAVARKLAREGKHAPLLSAFIPREFYTLATRPSFSTSTATGGPSPGVKATPAYRHEVRGHERVLLRRGPLPLADRDRRELLRRRYRVYEGDLDGWAAERLSARCVPSRPPGTWLAVLATRVKAHERGPLGAPLVPACRVVER